MPLIIDPVGFHESAYHSLDLDLTYNVGAEGAQIRVLGGTFGGAQIYAVIEADTVPLGAQLLTSHFGHTDAGYAAGYHNEPNGYHQDPYHSTRIVAGMGAQVGIQTLTGFGAQVRAAIYNIDNLRILCSFPSRGNGSNWTASSTFPSTTNSFHVNNLNTDFVEQVWRSASGVKTGILLDCDAGAGNTIFMDTFAMMNHNLTTSANVRLIGSNNSGHSPSGEEITLVMTRFDFCYIAPDLPLAGWRYWRIEIDDVTNPDDYIYIGTVVFGAATIFNDECFVDRVVKTPVNYADTIPTEAYSNVMNDRGIKNRLSMTFRNIRFNGPNWSKLNDEFQEAGTILKCLWVPTPEFPLRYMMFSKLRQIPQETHNVKGANLDFIDFNIELDESL